MQGGKRKPRSFDTRDVRQVILYASLCVVLTNLLNCLDISFCDVCSCVTSPGGSIQFCNPTFTYF